MIVEVTRQAISEFCEIMGLSRVMYWHRRTNIARLTEFFYVCVTPGPGPWVRWRDGEIRYIAREDGTLEFERWIP